MKKLLSLLILLSAFICQAQDTMSTKSGLRYVVLKKGNGDQAYANRMVKVLYTGMFESLDTFDQSSPEGFEFILGRGHVIKGWDEGVRLMSIGDRYLFFIPPKLAYGNSGLPDVIPPNSALIFDVELLEVNDL